LTAAEREKRQQRRAFLAGYKAMVGCKDCGETDPSRLQFDHRNKATKRFKVGANVGYGWASILAEITKCDVRCGPCHTRRHHRDEPGARRNNKNRFPGRGRVQTRGSATPPREAVS
jgi:hypothetical protein